MFVLKGAEMDIPFWIFALIIGVLAVAFIGFFVVAVFVIRILLTAFDANWPNVLK